jgi:ribonuclease HI
LLIVQIAKLHVNPSSTKSIKGLKMTDVVEIFADGACKGNPGPGGFGTILRCRGVEKELFGGEKHTTNNRMELLAVIEGFRALKRSCQVSVTTDSQYVQKGMSEWIIGWKKNNWHGSAGPVKNADLWKELDKLQENHAVQWNWVRGHNGHEMNERCDALANKGVDSVRG